MNHDEDLHRKIKEFLIKEKSWVITDQNDANEVFRLIQKFTEQIELENMWVQGSLFQVTLNNGDPLGINEKNEKNK